MVLQASGPNGLTIIRSLGRAGVPVIAADADPTAMGLRSRYAAARTMPDPLTDPDGFVDAVVAGSAALPRPVLFPTHDETLIAIGPREREVERVAARPWSPWATHARIMDKGYQHAVAREIGFPVPRSVEPVDDGDVAAVAGSLRFPVVLKPRNDPRFRRASGLQLLRASDPEELRRAWDRLGGAGAQVSEVIPGGDDRVWSLGSYRDRNGRPLASWTGRKLRQWPPDFGTGRAAESLWDPEYARRGHELLDALGYHGISQLETKLDPRDGRQYLIEVNARSWLFVGAAIVAGVDIPLAAYLDATGRPRTWPEGHRNGVRWVLATRHVPAGIAEVARGEFSARALLHSLRPPLHDGVLDLRDPAPGLTLLSRQASRALRRR